MQLFDTLTELLASVRDREREIRFIDGQHDESVLSFGELWHQALALLGALQARGMQPGDELVIFCKSNRDFVTAFWAAVLGGITPVPSSLSGKGGPAREFIPGEKPPKPLSSSRKGSRAPSPMDGSLNPFISSPQVP